MPAFGTPLHPQDGAITTDAEITAPLTTLPTTRYVRIAILPRMQPRRGRQPEL